jgi:hypothetical protein
MVLVNFKDDKGNDVQGYIDENLKKNLDVVKDSVLNREWDYVAIVAGIPGVGKSTFLQMLCKYLDPTFNVKDRVCFKGTGKDSLIERTTNAKKGQAFALDESFESLNTQLTKSSEFLRIINHLQLIRQTGLFIVLSLPNFFDLAKGIAIFRTSHLFVVYHDSYKRGYFAAFGRDEKRKLYVKGNKFMNYNAAKPNFRGRFVKSWIADLELYLRLKYEHLQEQAIEKAKKISKDLQICVNLINFMRKEGYRVKKIAEVAGVERHTIRERVKLVENYGFTRKNGS